jgi:DNA repair exonuclease SbcCD nuclease subunit
MNNVKFLSFSDVHISSINPSSRKGNYEEDILKKLEQIKEIGKINNVDFFICAGDIFNLKSPIRNTHELVGKLINLFKTFPAPIYSIEGNHDLRNDNYETFKEQPLYVLYASDALIQIRNIEKKLNNIKICIRGIPFSETIDISKIEKTKNDNDINIFVLHLYSSPEGGFLYKSKIYSYEELSLLGDDIFILGHYHKDQGITKEKFNNKEQIFVNVGAISRGTISEDDIKRIPKVALIEIKKENSIKIDFKEIPLSVKPVEEVFDFTNYEKEKKEKKDIQEFISKLRSDLIEGSNEEGLINELKTLDLDKKIYEKVLYFIQNADIIEMEK